MGEKKLKSIVTKSDADIPTKKTSKKIKMKTSKKEKKDTISPTESIDSAASDTNKTKKKKKKSKKDHGIKVMTQSDEQAAKPLRSNLKTNYRRLMRWETLYTGGKIVVIKEGRYGVSIVEDVIKVFSIRSLKVKYTISPKAGMITTFSVLPNNDEIVTIHSNMQMNLWHVNRENPPKKWKLTGGIVVDSDIDTTGTLCATGSTDSCVKVWDIHQGFCTHNLRGHEGVVNIVRFDRRSSEIKIGQQMLLFSGGQDGSIRVWNLYTKTCLVMKNHMASVTSFAFSSCGSTMLSGGRDRVMSVWNLNDFSLRKTIPIFQTVEGIHIIPDDQLSPVADSDTLSLKSNNGPTRVIVGGGEDGGDVVEKEGIRLLEVDLVTGKIIRKSPQPLSYPINGILECEDKSKFLVVTRDHNLLYFDTQTLVREQQIVGFNDEITDIKFSGENSLVVATNSDTVRVYDTNERGCEFLTGHTDIVIAIDVSLDGTLLATGAKDRSIRIWNLKTNKCIGFGKGHTESIGSLALSKKNNCNFLVSASSDMTVKLWNLAPLANYLGDEEMNDGPIELGTKFTQKAHDKDINSVDVAPNDKFFASGSQDRSIKIWGTEKGDQKGVMLGHTRGIWCVAFSPVDKCIASASQDASIKIWSLVDYSCLKTFQGHSGGVLKVSFLSHGMQLISTGAEGLIKMWTIKTQECIKTLDAHTDKIWALAVNQDGSKAVSGGNDSLIQVWYDSTAEDATKKLEEQEQAVVQDQEFMNCMLSKNFTRALELAIDLNQPNRCFRILDQFIEVPPEKFPDFDNDNQADNEDIESSSEKFESILKGVFESEKNQTERIARVFGYIREWNTNARECNVAQRLLNYFLRKFRPSFLQSIQDCADLIKAISAYTDRHFQRIDQLQQQSYLLDHTLFKINLFAPIPLEEQESKHNISQEQQDAEIETNQTLNNFDIPIADLSEEEEEEEEKEEEEVAAPPSEYKSVGAPLYKVIKQLEPQIFMTYEEKRKREEEEAAENGETLPEPAKKKRRGFAKGFNRGKGKKGKKKISLV